MDTFAPAARTLVIPARADPERDAVAQAWSSRGGAVWRDRAELAQETRGLPFDTLVLRSEVVRLTAEARAFTCAGAVLTAATYEGNADAREARTLFDAVLGALPSLPPCVLDAGRLDDGRWVLLEANAAWGAGLNGCDAARALPAIAAATLPSDDRAQG